MTASVIQVKRFVNKTRSLLALSMSSGVCKQDYVAQRCKLVKAFELKLAFLLNAKQFLQSYRNIKYTIV